MVGTYPCTHSHVCLINDPLLILDDRGILMHWWMGGTAAVIPVSSKLPRHNDDVMIASAPGISVRVETQSVLV